MDEEDPFHGHDDLQPEMKQPTKRKAGRAKSTDNVRIVEMRKERSRNAARNRRGKENAQFDELAKLLPLPAAITSQLDKASIIRLTVSYLSMREFSGIVPPRQLTDGESSLSPLSETTTAEVTSAEPLTLASNTEIVPFQKNEGPKTGSLAVNETGTQLLHWRHRIVKKVVDPRDEVSWIHNSFDDEMEAAVALEGFLLVLSEEGKIMYVSETVSTNLGLSQVELTGGNVYNYVHVEDHPDLMDQLKQSLSRNKDPFPDSQGFFSCQQNNDISSLFDQGDAIGPSTLPFHMPRAFFLRMKCTLVRRGGSYAKSSGFKVVHCVGRIKAYVSNSQESPRKAFVMLAQPVPTMNINELPLECNMFVSRVNMDLKIVYCEGRIHKFMDYLAKDIVGISAYDFYHAGDVALIQGHHAKFLSKGQVWTKYYRWMNKNGGWVWMQTKASLIPHPSNPSLKQMLCLNYILSDVEHRSVVLGMAQLKDKPKLDCSSNLSEVACEADPSGELKDALIDDQVVVFPKWHATSDKLVPEKTLLDHLTLERTGYNAQVNESLKSWAKQHKWIEQPSEHESSPENDIVDKDLQDIVDIIDADMTTFDRSLIDFVVSGNAQLFGEAQPSQLGPIGAYIEEISDSSTEPNNGNNLVPKVEDEVTQSNLGAVSFCSQARRNASEFSKGSNSVGREGAIKRPACASMPYNYGTIEFKNTIPNKIPRLSHMSGFQMLNKPVGRPTSTITAISGSQDSDPCQMPCSSVYGSVKHTGSVTSTSTKPNVPCIQASEQGSVGIDDRKMAPPAVCTSPNSYRTKPQTLATSPRKPKSLLEQLTMLPTKDNDPFNDDLMFEIVEELLEEGTGDYEMARNLQGLSGDLDNNEPELTTLIPRQEIKQEVVTPTSTESRNSFSDCFQGVSNFSNSYQRKSPTSGQYQRSGPIASDAFSSGLECVKVEVPVCMASASMNMETSDTLGTVFPERTGSPYLSSVSSQSQWGKQQQKQLRQSSWQQKQNQQEPTPVIQPTQRLLFPMPQQGTNKLQTVTHSFSQQQAQHQQKLQQLKKEQQQKQLQQQHLQKLQQQQQGQHMIPQSSNTPRQNIFRELNEFIQNNNIHTGPNLGSQNSLTISSGPLPELGNGLDEELNNLPIQQQTQNSSSISNQSYNNGNVGRGDTLPHNLNFTGMM